MPSRSFPNGFIVAIATTLAVSMANVAVAETLGAKMKIYFKGIPVGKLYSSIVIGNGQYSIKGSGRTNAVISIITKTKGTFRSSGRLAGRKVVPNVHASDFKRGRKKSNSSLKFKDANVVSVSATPPIKYKPGSVPVTPDHFQNVIDPVSSLLFPLGKGETASGGTVCNRTVPVFSGKTRMNLVFKFKTSGKVKTDGFNGTVYTCGVRYKPVSGHRPASKSTKFLVGRSDIEVSMAEIGTSGVFAMFGFSLPIRQGVISGKTQTFAVQ